MTRPINLYTLSRIPGEDAFNRVYHHAANTISRHRTGQHEIGSLRTFADEMIRCHVPLNAMDGFFLGFTIPQIGKEFDLLKIGAEGCLNIELKSQPVPLEQIRAQLVKNHHYLSHLGKNMTLYTFVSDTRQCFRLDGDVLAQVEIEDIAKAVWSYSGDCLTEIDGLFRPSEYIVSPATTPEKFLNREYFLTQAQDQVQRHLLSALNETTGLAYLSLTGKPGTGKTLLLYDVARSLGTQARTAILHWGPLTDGHRLINAADISLTILPWQVLEGDDESDTHDDTTKSDVSGDTTELDVSRDALSLDASDDTTGPDVSGNPVESSVPTGAAESEPSLPGAVQPLLGSYSYVLVDEAHRLSPQQFRTLCQTAEHYRQRVVFCLDPEQILTTAERQYDIAGHVASLPLTASFILSERLRGNRELLSFIQKVRDLNSTPQTHMEYQNVDLGYAGTIAEAQAQLAYYRDQGYVFINYYRTALGMIPMADGSEAGKPGDTTRKENPPDNEGTFWNIAAPTSLESPDSASGLDRKLPPETELRNNPFAQFEGGYDIHHVIGQEFDRVVLLLDNSFYYTDEGKLEGIPSPDPDFLYPNLFYQSITRVQERLALIVLQNEPLFDRISEILER